MFVATRDLNRAPPKMDSDFRVSTATTTPGSAPGSAAMDAGRGRFEAVMRLRAGSVLGDAIIVVVNSRVV